MKRAFILALGVACVFAVRTQAAVSAFDKPGDCRVEPLIQSVWGQTTDTGREDGNSCFNSEIVQRIGAKYPYAGCLFIALAQIMRYHSWPTAAATNASYSCTISAEDGVKTNRYSTITGTYDWANMTANTLSGASQTVRQALGKLIYNLAISAGSDFSPSGTLARVSTARRRLLDYFGYASCEDVYFNANNCPLSTDKLKKMILPNLDAGMPVILSVACPANDGVHEFVVDGYGYDTQSRLLVHVNAGAWGAGNGWYDLTEGFHVGELDYTRVEECLFNLFSVKKGTIVSGRVFDASRRAIADATVTVLQGGNSITNTKTNARGVYGLILSPGTYTLRAESETAVVTEEIVVSANESRQFIDGVGEGNYWDDPSHAPVIGNVFGFDLVFPGYYSAQAVAPVISPANRTITGLTEVTISSTTSNAVIRYTLDNSEPTVHSPQYTGAFNISDTLVVKAIAFARGMEPSPVTSASFIYSNANTPVGDDFSAPMMLVGTNITHTVQNYINYTRDYYNDPIIEQDYYDLQGYTYEDHSAWFAWTATGTGKVRVTSVLMGPEENGYLPDYDAGDWYDCTTWTPNYGTIMGAYEGNDIQSLAFITGEQSGIEDGYQVYKSVVTNEFSVIQGQTYYILCECPYYLPDMYYDPIENVALGPYYYDNTNDCNLILFNATNSYLSISLSADVTTTTPVTKLTVPSMPHAQVKILADTSTLGTTAAVYSMTDETTYTIVYTAETGYSFSDGRTTWSTTLRDDTGLDVSVADVEDFPASGPTRETRTILFEMNGVGAQVPVLSVSYGDTATAPATPVMKGYVFNGWFDDAEGEQAHNWNASVTADTVVYASWTENADPWNTPEADSDVADALEADGFGGAAVTDLTTVSDFEAFQDYLTGTGISAPTDLTTGQRANAYLCYRLNATDIPSAEVTSDDVQIESFALQSGSAAITVSIDGIEPGQNVSAEAIATVLSAAGGVSPDALSNEDVTLSGYGLSGGLISVTIQPNAGKYATQPTCFFLRAVLRK